MPFYVRAMNWTGGRTRPPDPLCATRASPGDPPCLWALHGVCTSLYRPTRPPDGRRAAVYPGPFGVPTVKTVATRPRRGNHWRGELSSDSARCDRQTAVRVARRVDFRAPGGGLSPRMMPPSSTTDTARTPPRAGHVTTGVRCTRPHTPRPRPTDRVGSASPTHTMSVGAFRLLCFARCIGRGLGEPVALTAAMLRFIGSRPDAGSRTYDPPVADRRPENAKYRSAAVNAPESRPAVVAL